MTTPLRRGAADPPALVRAVAALLAVAAAVALAGCGPGAAAVEDRVATTTVDLPPSYRFAPADIAVGTGATVTWTNHDNFTHTVAFAGSDPLRMAPGESVTRTFPTPGSYPYVCSLHPTDMQGSVLVTES